MTDPIGGRIPYRVVCRDARFHVIRVDLTDKLHDTLAQVMLDSPSVSEHNTEAEAERWIRDRILDTLKKKEQRDESWTIDNSV